MISTQISKKYKQKQSRSTTKWGTFYPQDSENMTNKQQQMGIESQKALPVINLQKDRQHLQYLQTISCEGSNNLEPYANQINNNNLTANQSPLNNKQLQYTINRNFLSSSISVSNQADHKQQSNTAYGGLLQTIQNHSQMVQSTQNFDWKSKWGKKEENDASKTKSKFNPANVSRAQNFYKNQNCHGLREQQRLQLEHKGYDNFQPNQSCQSNLTNITFSKYSKSQIEFRNTQQNKMRMSMSNLGGKFKKQQKTQNITITNQEKLNTLQSENKQNKTNNFNKKFNSILTNCQNKHNEEEQNFQSKKFNKQEVYQYWDNEYSKQIKKNFKSQESIRQSLQNIKKEKPIKQEKCTNHGEKENLGAETISEDGIQLILERFTRVFGPMKDKETIQKIMREQNIEENEEIYELIEDNYRDVFRDNMDRFLGMSFEQYCQSQKHLKFGDQPSDEFDINEHPVNVAVKLFDSAEFEVNLDRLNLRVNDFIDSYQNDPHVKPVTKINRLQGERYRIELCQRFGITQEQLCKMFISKMSQDKKHKIIQKAKSKAEPFQFDENVINFEDFKNNQKTLQSIDPEIYKEVIAAERSVPNKNYWDKTPSSPVIHHSKPQNQDVFKGKITISRNKKDKRVIRSKSMTPGSMMSDYTPRFQKKELILKAYMTFRDRIYNEARRQKYDLDFHRNRKKYLKNPATAPNPVEDIIEHNLEAILNDSSLHDFVEKGIEDAEEMAIVNKNADIIFDGLKQRNDEQMEQKLQAIMQKEQKMNTINKFQIQNGGISKAKINYLVNKFINKLKNAVLTKNDVTLKKAKEQFIQEILKKNNFQKGYKKAKICKQNKVKLGQEEHTIQSQKINMLNTLAEKIVCNVEEDQNTLNRSNIINLKKIKGFQKKDNKVFREENSMITNSERDGGETNEKQNQFKNLKESIINSSTIDKFVERSLNSNAFPLPILNKINTNNNSLILNKYKINQENANSLAQAMLDLVPLKLKQLILIENMINDETMSILFKTLSQNQLGGLETLTIIQNQIGDQAMYNMSHNFFESEAAQDLKKFIIKAPMVNFKTFNWGTMAQSLNDNVNNIRSLRTLVLSQMNMNMKTIVLITEAIELLPSLQHLDVSATGMKGQSMYHLLNGLLRTTHLRTLNISENSMNQYFVHSCCTDKYKEEGNAIGKLTEYIHLCSLLHINIGSMNLCFEGIKYVLENGLRRSRTIQSCHMTGILQLAPEQQDEIKGVLKINEKVMVIGKMDRTFKSMINQQVSSTVKNLMGQNFKNVANKDRDRMKELLKEPQLKCFDEENVIFQRNLGRIEIPGAHRWKQSTGLYCELCNKLCYTVFVWNLQVQKQEKTQKRFWDQSWVNKPIIQDSGNLSYNYPLISIKGKVQKMIPMIEFQERLEKNKHSGTYQTRSADNELEQQQIDQIKVKIEKDFIHNLRLQPTYWNEAQEIVHEKIKEDGMKFKPKNLGKNESIPAKYADYLQESPLPFARQFSHLPKYIQSIAIWDKKVGDNLPDDAFQPVNLKNYAELIRKTYEALPEYYQEESYENELLIEQNQRVILEIQKMEQIARETFFASVYLPCHHDYAHQGKGFEVIVQHPNLKHSDYLNIDKIPQTPANKHLSVKTMRVSYKQLKKIRQIRRFSRPQSVFYDWRIETPQLTQKAWELDEQFLKLHKFIKDGLELEKTKETLKRYYLQLKVQFLTFQADPDFYPAIGWMDFVNICVDGWDMIDDKTLTRADVDRAFIATNFEEVDLEANDDRDLCRYEFLEIIVRLAKQKYIDSTKKQDVSVSEATEKLIEEYIIPNFQEKMPWQPFREEEIWVLEIDDLYKENKKSCDALFKWCKTGPHSKDPSILNNEDCIAMFDKIDQSGSNIAQLVCLCYSLSKIPIIDEMEQFDDYHKLKKCEFYEFLARMAWNLYDENEELPLISRLERLLQLLFSTILNKQLLIPCFDDGIDSNSDYEDDIINNIQQEILLEKEQKNDDN